MSIDSGSKHRALSKASLSARRNQARGEEPPLRRGMRFVTLFVVYLIASRQLPAESSSNASYSQTETQNGTALKLEVKHVDPVKTAKDPLEEFENVIIQLRLADGASKSPLSGSSPAAWIDRRIGSDRTTPNQCAGKVKRLAEG